MRNDLGAELSKNPQYIDRVNKSIGDLKTHFEEIKKILYKPLSNHNINDAFTRFNEIFDCVPLLKNELSQIQIVRGRPHNLNSPLCKESWEISYNWRFREKIELGRFNQKGEPLFYGSLPTESTDIDYILASALECCKELTLEYNCPPKQEITLGGWIVDKPFYVVNLCFDDKHLSQNPKFKSTVDLFISTIKSYFSFEVSEFVETFYRYFSEMSRTIMNKNECYPVLVALFHSIRFYYERYNKQPIYGLIYPGAMTLGKGLNTVLTREAVNEFLRLDKVVMYQYDLSETDNKTWTADKCTDIVKVKGHKFNLTNYMSH